MRSRVPKISIVTPSLNQGQFIEDAILSVEGQGYPQVEHLVIDGGSTDNTLEVLRRYPHIKWISEPDRGQSDALNKGFRLATGELIGWLNADEFYLPNAFRRVGYFAGAHPGAAVIYGDIIFVNEIGCFLRPRLEHDFDYKVLLWYGCYIPSVATFFRRGVVDRGEFLDTTYRVTMDFEYFVRLARLGLPFRHIPVPIGAFRWQGANASLQADVRKGERLRVQRAAMCNQPTWLLDGLARIHWWRRVLLKASGGQYYRQWNSRQHRGSGTRWFRSPEEHRNCLRIILGISKGVEGRVSPLGGF